MAQTERQIIRGKRPWRRVLTVSLSILLVLLLALGGTAVALTRRGLPKLTGRVNLPGLTAPVQITRDEEGVPHIEAESLRDLYMAQGYVHAQDRLFQMDLSRRQASGRLSEIFGDRALETDKMFRTLGLRRAAEASWPTYNEEIAGYIQAYADGVNAYIDQHAGGLSIEFFLNGYKPEPWSPVDSLTIGKYMSFDLAGHWEAQAFRQYLLDTFPKDEALELFPENTDPKDSPLIIGNVAGIADRFVKASDAKPDEWNGSNNWVVSGDRTESGLPILSNDPHLSIASPSVWYQNHLRAGGMNVSGVIFAGAPGVIVGHNDHIAWGVTNTGPDVQDLYIEKINPDNPYQYLYNDQWIDAEVVQEDIAVKGGSVEPFEVVITRHGPILSDMAMPNEDNMVYALRWTALDPSRELESVVGMNAAKDWESFEKALESFHSPTQNFVFACDDGTIAYKANGKIPIRKGDGLLPVPGWTDEYDWQGFIPYDELPSVVNPPEGFIATANHKVIGGDYPYHISHNWSQPHRQERIVEVLSGLPNATAADMQALQGDVLDLHAREMLPVMMKGLAEPTEREAEMLALLADWDYETKADSAGALVFNLWFLHLSDVIFEDRFSEEAGALFTGRGYIVDGLLRMEDSGKASKFIANKGGLSAVLRESLARALKQIEAAQGKDAAKWTWGRFHQVQFVHPLSSVAILRPLFNAEGKKPSPGTNTTVRAASWNRSGLNNHGASWRMVRDFAEPAYAYHIVAPGISEHPLSPYYHKQFDRWIEAGQYKTYADGTAEGKTLTLAP